jgi:hypothetical protein
LAENHFLKVGMLLQPWTPWLPIRIFLAAVGVTNVVFAFLLETCCVVNMVMVVLFQCIQIALVSLSLSGNGFALIMTRVI